MSDYTKAQELRNLGKTILEIVQITGLTKWAVKQNTKPKPRVKKSNAPKEGNREKLYKGEIKVREGLKVFKTRKDQDDGKTLIQVNKNTWVYSDKPEAQAIEDCKKRHDLI